MAAKLAEAEQMTVEEFLAFAQARPEGERWELIEGIAVMSPSPTEWHQVISGNILTPLIVHKNRCGASWLPILGGGTRVPISPNSLPQPDVFVKSGAAANSHVTDDALIIFEVISKSNTRTDQAWRKRVYSSVANCQHYVTLSTRTQEATRYDRTDGWQGETITAPDAALRLPAIDVAIPLSDIYRWTSIK